MNLGNRSIEAETTSIHDRLSDWRQLLDRCGRKPTRKRVHALRVVTLRLLAELELDLAELPSASHQAQAILEFNKQGEKLRKALGPVRELDVWIGKLQGLRASHAQSGDYVPRSTRECVRQLERFESRLKERRRPLEKKLIAAIKKREGEFAGAMEEVAAAVDGRVVDSGIHTASRIRDRFAAIARDFPAFNEENLHEFRKRIKMVRYLAEIHQADSGCAQVATQMKKLQSAIGEWHDWQALVREIRRGRSKSEDAAELLETIAAESLESALTTCRHITDKLIGAHAAQSDSGRKAPARVDHDPKEIPDRKLA